MILGRVGLVRKIARIVGPSPVGGGPFACKVSSFFQQASPSPETSPLVNQIQELRLYYSARSAIIGSTRAARTAGTTAAVLNPIINALATNA